MQVPMGVSGVQAVPNTLHSQGFKTPLRISPHLQALWSATLRLGMVNLSSASNWAYSG